MNMFSLWFNIAIISHRLKTSPEAFKAAIVLISEQMLKVIWSITALYYKNKSVSLTL